MTTGTITITGLDAIGHHGVFGYERELGQRFSVDLELTISWPEHDLLAATVDYAAVAMETVALIAGEPVTLIETLASRIADQVLSHVGVLRVCVTVNKPDAPIPTSFKNVAVTLVREREHD
ncbi:MAG: dihydroneopterin aldolase [Propionibacteriaceae bacterium]|jgi:dihydroneopterin aldolase|nr:dihydroneopterin aldolase [Propionibacteriaceae bacterium]